MRAGVAPFLAAVVAVFVAGCGAAEEASNASTTELEGVPWVLTAGLDGKDWAQGVPSVTFQARRLGGFTGCNSYDAPYVVDGSMLEVRVRQLAQTAAGCSPPSDREELFLGALERVAAWRIEADELVLLDGDDEELLRFGIATPVGSWVTTDWPTTLIPGTRLTATLTEDGELSGSTGCNDYAARYTLDQGAIEITKLAVTEMLCQKPALVMEQEAEFLEALASATRYSVHHKSLHLFGADDELLVWLRPGTR